MNKTKPTKKPLQGVKLGETHVVVSGKNKGKSKLKTEEDYLKRQSINSDKYSNLF